MGDGAMVPLAIFKSLSIYSICSFAIFNRFIYLIFTYVRFIYISCVTTTDVLYSIFVRRVLISPSPYIIG